MLFGLHQQSIEQGEIELALLGFDLPLAIGTSTMFAPSRSMTGQTSGSIEGHAL